MNRIPRLQKEVMLFFFFLFFASAQAQVNFTSNDLGNADIQTPTSLQFGPDDRLYVAQQDGVIKIYSILRTALGVYEVTQTETIDLVRQLQNHNDDGSPYNPIWNTRLTTGLLVSGTASNPIIYVSSSDPRVAIAQDSGLDTNSGRLTMLSFNGSTWVLTDLVRGLPRSEENHGPNGMVLHNGDLYLCQGGNTNMGAPSNNFAFLPEFALSAAILKIDLLSLMAMPDQVDSYGTIYKYNLPTLDDPSRLNDPSTAQDVNDPFGGNDGFNQAIIDINSPVQVHSPGWRNLYDIAITQSGQMYGFDNGGNIGWGGPPIIDASGSCTNDPNENDSNSDPDGLHLVSGAGYYAGHPNPIRASTSNTVNGVSPVPFGNPVECTYLQPGVPPSSGGNQALITQTGSNNGIIEYTASNFGGALQGHLLVAAFNNSTIAAVELNGTGTEVINVSPLLTGFGDLPLDVTALGDSSPFPGTIWVATYASNSITVFEPNDFGQPCNSIYDVFLDDDNDNYSNADEIDNGTDPCNAAVFPQDNDSDQLSDLNDPDDDNDGILDLVDAFQIDPLNGTDLDLPFELSFSPIQNAGGFFNMGFTGLMFNGVDDYLTQYDIQKIIPGGAAGVFTVEFIGEGDAYENFNDQDYGFQFGLDVAGFSNPYSIETRLKAPFFNNNPSTEPEQSFGIFIGDGSQEHYLKFVLSNINGGRLLSVLEFNGIVQFTGDVSVAPLSTDDITLYIDLIPDGFTLKAALKYSLDDGASIQTFGSQINLPSAWLNASLAIGIIGSSRGNATEFSAGWDYIKGYEIEICETVGESCDDENPTTFDDVYNISCECVGTPCPQAGTGCDDGNPATFDDTENGFCECIGVSCPITGTPCDDGDPTTVNDQEDGFCNCAGELCPPAGNPCDDENLATFDDQTDGFCNCIGTPCPLAGTVCDDGDLSTENDAQDGFCNCIGTPCPPFGTPCDDGDAATINDQQNGYCSCVGEEIVAPDCSDLQLLGTDIIQPDICSANNGSIVLFTSAYENFNYSIQLNGEDGPIQDCQREVIIKINAGVNAVEDFIDDSGYVTTGFRGATGLPDNFINTTGAPDDIFASEQFGGQFWELEVTQTGHYEICLFFAETYDVINGPGQRVFDVMIEDELVLEDFDIVQETGFGVAIKRCFFSFVEDGFLSVRLIPKVQSPVLKALQLNRPCQFSINQLFPGNYSGITVQAEDYNCSLNIDENFVLELIDGCDPVCPIDTIEACVKPQNETELCLDFCGINDPSTIQSIIYSSSNTTIPINDFCFSYEDLGGANLTENIGVIACDDNQNCNYQVVALSVDSQCIDTNIDDADKLISLIEIPNTFTPNGDGINESFKAQISSQIAYRYQFSLKIYNRYGQQLYKTSNENNKKVMIWDGKSINNSDFMPAGTYYYILIVENDSIQQSFSGYIQLIY